MAEGKHMQDQENQSGDLQDPAEPKQVDQDVQTEENAAEGLEPTPVDSSQGDPDDDALVTREEVVQETETVTEDGPDAEQVRREAARTQTTKDTYPSGLGNDS